MGAVSPSELRAVSEKSLLLLAGTIADMEVILCYLLVISKARIEVLHVLLLGECCTSSMSYLNILDNDHA